MFDHESRPAALLLADGIAASERVGAAADLAGCRVAASVGLADALELLRDPPPFQLVIAELERDGGAPLDALLRELDRTAKSGKPLVISAPFELIDAIDAQVRGGNVKQLSLPTDEQMVEAVAEAAQTTDASVHDSGRSQLQQLSQETARIASALAALSERADDLAPADPPRDDGPIDSARIRAIIRARRLREQYFPPDLFADPAWDMLLDLTAARLDGQHVAVSSLCIAAAVPATTALRWIKALTEHGLFVRVADPSDGRRVHIELSEATATAVLDYLRAAQRLGVPII